MVKLISVERSTNKRKKYQALFKDDVGEWYVDFGAAGMSDYTIHKDKERRERYILRHLKDLSTNDPTRAGYLSMFVLWNKPSLKGSIADYRKRLAIYNKTGRFPKDI